MKTLLILAAFLFIVASISSSIDAANICAAFTFNNGSKVSFGNTQNFVGDFKQMAQSGGGNYDWSMSLCDTSQQDPSAPSCAAGLYMAQTSACDVQINGKPSIQEMYGGGGIQFQFPGASQANGYTWTNTISCVCDTTASKLACPGNAYQVSVTGQQVTAAWTLRSVGCCIDGSGPAPGPGGDGKGGDEGGLTWGGVFLIIFFVPSGLYVIGMVAWNYKQGKTGKELAPHPEFWGALPSLAKDGIVFIWCKIRGTPFTPSESGSSSSAAGASSGAEAGTYTSV